jgi:oligopeptide transport system ATP-binding protein
MSQVTPLLEVRDLRTYFYTHAGVVKAVDGVSFHIEPGETVGIVGESGSGKSVTALSIMGLLPRPAGRIVGGTITFQGKDLTTATDREMRELRGSAMAMIFQDPMTSLNPVFSIGYQLAEPMKRHLRLSGKDATARAAKLLDLVGIPSASRRLKDYPHQFSGGMRQRVMIAMALACNPKLLIADEPTTALDVTIQAQILELIKGLRREFNMAVLLITHDLGVVANMCDRVTVMYGGRVLESGSSDEIFTVPRQPYTQGLLHSIPRLDQPRGEELTPIPGNPPDMLHPLPGCPFTPRCPLVIARCPGEMPPLERLGESQHRAACWVTVGGHTADAPQVTGAVGG